VNVLQQCGETLGVGLDINNPIGTPVELLKLIDVGAQQVEFALLESRLQQRIELVDGGCDARAALQVGGQLTSLPQPGLPVRQVGLVLRVDTGTEHAGHDVDVHVGTSAVLQEEGRHSSFTHRAEHLSETVRIWCEREEDEE
jgi:hypothetical protein